MKMITKVSIFAILSISLLAFLISCDIDYTDKDTSKGDQSDSIIIIPPDDSLTDKDEETPAIPDDSENNDNTQNPDDSENNDDTQNPDDSENNDNTQNPDDSENGENTPQPPVNVYYTVEFNTQIPGEALIQRMVKHGGTVNVPTLEYRDGFRLLGWALPQSDELYSFNLPITTNLSLNAVWEAEEANLIYDSFTPVFVIHDGTTAANSHSLSIAENLNKKISAEVVSQSHIYASRYHEIVIGNTSRDISKNAYNELQKLTGNENKIAYLIYSDGKSLALAYTSAENYYALDLVSEKFLNEYIRDSLSIPAGVVESFTLPYEEYLQNKDEENREAEWKRLESVLISSVGNEKAEDFISALKDLYSLYTPDMVTWYANLYDPLYGGFYYSNSARDNKNVTYLGETYPLLPDVESTNQALNFIISSGMAENYKDVLPDFMKEQIINFVISLQDANGYFYHPQWPKELTDSKISRRARDLIWSENILKKLGAQPLYDTPTGTKGSSSATTVSYLTMPLSASAVSAVSRVVATAEVAVPDHLKSRESFIAYLNNFDIANRSYHVGNELVAQTSQIIYRDQVLASEGADYKLMDILINWLNEHQHADTGHWHTETNYYATNGLLKISGIYNDAQVKMPNSDAAVNSAIAAITSDEPMGAVVDLYNTWFTIQNVVNNLRKYGNAADKTKADEIVQNLRLDAPDAIRKSKEKISVFKKADGSFSYGPEYSSSTSQGMPVALINSPEGDINGNGIASTGLIGYMMNALELSSYKPALFGKYDLFNYINIIEENNKKVELMKPQDISGYEKTDFSDGNIPNSIVTSLLSNGASADASEGALLFNTTAGANDSVTFTTSKVDGANVSIFNADICISDISGNDTVYQIFCDSAEGARAYMLVIGYKDGALTISDTSNSSSSEPTRVYQTMITDIAPGKTFNFGIEYYSLEDGTARIKLFVDKSLVFVSDNFYDSHKSETAAQTNLAKIRFYTLNSVVSTLKIDNIVFAQDTVIYKDIETGAK